MKVIGYISEENDKLYDLNTMIKIIGTSKSKIQREIKRNKLSEYMKYKNQFLYSENTLFTIMERLIIERISKEL
jgi:hypothetical protein